MTRTSRRQFHRQLAGAAGLGLAAAIVPSPGSAAAVPSASAGSLTDVPGVRVGHFTDSRRPTGCTAILFDHEVSAGVDYDGSAPGDWLGVMLQPSSPIDTIHGMLLVGGGPFGLGAVPGVVRFLEEHRQGFDWGIPNVRIPIVVGAVIDDLSLGDGTIRPDAEAAFKACQGASSAPVQEGCVGVGHGATVGKMLRGRGYGGMKGGLGSASLRIGELVIAALAVVNANGDIYDWRKGQIVAGGRLPDGKGFVNIVEQLKKEMAREDKDARLVVSDDPFRSTTLVVVATNAPFSKSELTKLAMMASTGAARAINPYHTTGDGDSTFALSTNQLKKEHSLSGVGSLAAELASEAVLRAVWTATSLPDWPAARDYPGR